MSEMINPERFEIAGLFEAVDDGYGFIRCNQYNISSDDIFVSQEMIRMFGLRTGDLIEGIAGRKELNKSRPLIYINQINHREPRENRSRMKFETGIPTFPNENFHLSTAVTDSLGLKLIDYLAPIGKGQRGMIVAPPKAGKTTIIKDIANGMIQSHPDTIVFILLIDERPEEVTDFIDNVHGNHVEIISSTFDESPENHKRVAEFTLERAKRLVECGQDVVILLDSITRLVRAYNLIIEPSGKTLSGGLDPAALYMPKKFFGAARNIRNGGSLTVISTALVDTGSRMDNMIFEEFRGTGNMELILSRELQERHIFPAIDILKSSTRRSELLLTKQEQDIGESIRSIYSTNANMEIAMKKVFHFLGNKQNSHTTR